MITVDLGMGEFTQMDESLLTPNHSIVDATKHRTEVTEWLLNGKIVHRSVNVVLKQGIGVEDVLAGVQGG